MEHLMLNDRVAQLHPSIIEALMPLAKSDLNNTLKKFRGDSKLDDEDKRPSVLKFTDEDRTLLERVCEQLKTEEMKMHLSFAEKGDQLLPILSALSIIKASEGLSFDHLMQNPDSSSASRAYRCASFMFGALVEMSSRVGFSNAFAYAKRKILQMYEDLR